MHIIKVDDSYCEWKYTISGLDDYSIDRIIEIIINTTGGVVINEELTKVHKHPSKLKLKRQVKAQEN